MSTILRCILGPRLYGGSSWDYSPNIIESVSDRVFSCIKFVYRLLFNLAPFSLMYIYLRGHLNVAGGQRYFGYFVTTVYIMTPCFLLRGCGRVLNQKYREFVDVLDKAHKSNKQDDVDRLREYDFDVRGYFPITYHFQDITPFSLDFGVKDRGAGYGVLSRWIHKFVVYYLGIAMLYPGATSVFNALLGEQLRQERKKWLKNRNGVRHRFKTQTGIEIDACFLDRRGKTENGNILVLCCEGNAAFWEAGCMGTAYECGYSVLGWNHPGFAGSSGLPYPHEDKCAAECVLQFAVLKAGFDFSHIVLNSWSIGGYTLSFLAAKYPEVKACFVDAPFDNIDVLAENQMPGFLSSIVLGAVKTTVDLNVAAQLPRYPGPIRIIRRTNDEVICTDRGVLASNRGNFLLRAVLEKRYPILFNCEAVQIAFDRLQAETGISRKNILMEKGAYGQQYEEILKEVEGCNRKCSTQENCLVWPSNIGEKFDDDRKVSFALAIANYYQVDLETTHCTPLPEQLFQIPSRTI